MTEFDPTAFDEEPDSAYKERLRAYLVDPDNKDPDVKAFLTYHLASVSLGLMATYHEVSLPELTKQIGRGGRKLLAVMN